MHEKQFLKQLDEDRVLHAIGEAEKQTSGEIRVYVSHKERHDAMEYAKRRFRELGMAKTKNRNAVLIYLVPRTQQFALYGDAGIHERCGEDFWKGIAGEMSRLLKAGQFTDAIVDAVKKVGQALARTFPPDGENPNELPDAIVRD